MVNYILTSLFFHVALMLALVYTVPVNTSSGDQVQVNIVEKSKIHSQAPILNYSRKLLKLGNGVHGSKKVQKFDMSDYGNRLKAIVDPVWVSHIEPYQAHLLKTYQIIVLLSIDKHGNIYRVKIKKGSGDSFFDNLAVQTFREIGTIPIPPESVVKDGIEWSLTF